jgi:hypothetical protein
MSFTPTTAQLELLADLEMARMPVALIANRLGVDHATFRLAAIFICSLEAREG